MLRAQSLGPIVRECLVHLLVPSDYVVCQWIESHRPKSSFQNLKKAFAGRKKRINSQKSGPETGVVGWIFGVSDGQKDEALEISH